MTYLIALQVQGAGSFGFGGGGKRGHDPPAVDRSRTNQGDACSHCERECYTCTISRRGSFRSVHRRAEAHKGCVPRCRWSHKQAARCLRHVIYRRRIRTPTLQNPMKYSYVRWRDMDRIWLVYVPAGLFIVTCTRVVGPLERIVTGRIGTERCM